MRNPLRFRPDPFDYSLLTGIHKEFSGGIPVGPESVTSISEIASTLSVAGGGDSSTDLALDIVLHEIAEQARLSIGATGVAIALTRAGELVCRATTGGAPDLGLRLDPYSGLSGLCLRTKTVQHCEDTEMDSRVDSAACRNLRVRSILVAPIVTKNGEAIGLLEAFSANPNHFMERDAETLMSFCGRIVHTIDSAQEAASSALRIAAGTEDTPSKTHLLIPDAGTPRARLTDRWTVLLTAAVIAVALFLGWMVGLADKHKVAIRKPVLLNSRRQPASQAHSIHNQSAEDSGARATAPAQQISPPRSPSTDPLDSKTARGENQGGGLVVYQNGKVIFREVAHSGGLPRKTVARRVAPLAIMPSAIIPAGKTELLTPEAANQYVTYRVQPLYPEPARRQHIQGAVVLKVLVGKDGGVQQVQVVSGDPKLASAAADAVAKWRFKPFLEKGQPAEFQTQVTVDFKLP